ncbi:MAG: hypothetical protein ACTSRI_02710 [Promethearchaeota archaeon]
MARIDGGKVTGTLKYGGIKYKIRNTEDFENESFGFPKNQDLPTDHFEFKMVQIVGAIASGKTTLADRYYAYRIWQQWQDAVDYFKIEDFYASIDAIKKSKKPVHYVIMDDTVSKLDSRQPMKNIDVTELYFEIRHELRKHAQKSGGLLGGLVILAMITQDYMAIDKRLRNSVMFTAFKTYDPICKELIPDQQINDLLLFFKDESVRKCNYKYRKFAVGIDAMGKYTLFYADRESLPTFEFKMVKGESIFKQQMEYLTHYLIDTFTLLEMPKDDLKAELGFELDRMEKSGERTRITKSAFNDIIIRAKRLQNIALESKRLESLKKLQKLNYEQQKLKRVKYLQQQNHLINHLIDNFILSNLTRDDIKAELFFEIDRMKKTKEGCLIEASSFPELIIKAKRLQKLAIEKIELKKQKGKYNSTNERKIMSELILHDTFKLSFREIADFKRISISTAHDHYTAQKKIQKNAFFAIKNKELEIET